MTWSRHKILQVILAALSCGCPLLLLVLLPSIEGRDWRVGSLDGLSVHSLTVATKDDRLSLYAVTERGGIYRSTNNGASWNAANQGLPVDAWNGIQIKSLLVSPADTQTLYVVSGPEPNQRAIFKSTDAGSHWLKVSPAWDGDEIEALALSPIDGQTLYAVVAGRVYYSGDSARTWNVKGWLPADTVPSQLLVDPHRPGAVYLGTRGQGVYASTDQGGSWLKMHRELAYEVVQALTADLRDADTLYVGTPDRLYVLVHGPSGWQIARYGLQGNSVHTIAVVPAQGTLVYAGTDSGIYATSDQGAHWVHVSSSRSDPGTAAMALDVQAQTLVHVDAQGGLWTQAFAYAATMTDQESAAIAMATAEPTVTSLSPALPTMVPTTAARTDSSAGAELETDRTGDRPTVAADQPTTSGTVPDGRITPPTQMAEGEALPAEPVSTPAPTDTPTQPPPVTVIATLVPTSSPDAAPVDTVRPGNTFAVTAVPTSVSAATNTPTPTVTPHTTPTNVPAREPTTTATSTPAREPTVTETSTPEPTVTETSTRETAVTETSTPEPTTTETSTPEPTITATSTREPTITATSTREPTFTATSTREPTITATSTPEPTVTATPSPEPTATVTSTIQPTTTPIMEPTATMTSTLWPTATLTLEPTVTATGTPTRESTASPIATPGLAIDCFSAGNILNWETSPEAPWSTSYSESHSGGCSAVSGEVADDQQSWLSAQVEGPFTISFYWRVSSEPGDELQFRACDRKEAQIGGEQGWTYVSYERTEPGTCTVEWRYAKDAQGTSHQDRGWIDDVVVSLP